MSGEAEINAAETSDEASVMRRKQDALDRILREWGYVPTPESRARARKRIDDAKASVTPESIAESRRLIEEARREILGIAE
jgi:hypothetical protein